MHIRYKNLGGLIKWVNIDNKSFIVDPLNITDFYSFLKSTLSHKLPMRLQEHVHYNLR